MTDIEKKDTRDADGFTRVEPVLSLASPEKEVDHGAHVKSGSADAAALMAAKFVGEELDPAEATRIRKKIDRNILPMMMALYAMQFVDKTTLNQGAVLGIKTDCNLSATQFNLLGSLFYIAYLAFELPQNLALQRFPVGKWMSANITIWAICLCCFAACHNFAGLAILRVLLGACEGSITAGFLIVTSMFYTHAEQSRRVGYWFLMNGTAQVISGLLGYAVLQMGLDHAFKPWRVFFLVTGGLTLLVAIWFFLRFPDSPTNARFLTDDEKIMAVERIRTNNAGLENKQWKREQFIEAFLDWKVWVFALLAAVDNVPNSLTNMSSQVIKLLGFTTWQTVLLGCVSGVIEILTIWTSTLCLKKWPKQRYYIGAIYLIPNVLGAALILGLPFSNKAGQLVAVYITGVGTPAFVIALALVNASNTGHTKKLTANTLFLVGYCLGNLLSPLMWEAKYAPHYVVPWTVILVCYILCIVLLLVLRFGLARENARRDLLSAEDNDLFGYIDETMEDGSKVTHKVDRGFLDQSDFVNLSFRYPL